MYYLTFCMLYGLYVPRQGLYIKAFKSVPGTDVK